MERKELVKTLKRFKKRISKKYGVKRMILFGSRSTENFEKDSDVDLILVGNFKGKNSLSRSPKFYLEWDIDLSVDFLCYNQKEFQKLKSQVSIVREAISNGIEI